MRMRIILSITLSAVLAAVVTAFLTGNESKAVKNGTSVVAAFYPLAFAAEQLGGADVTVTNLTPAGAEPHDLELKPSDVAAVKDAGVVLLMGHGFQPQLERVAADSDAKVLTLLDTPGLHRHGRGSARLARPAPLRAPRRADRQGPRHRAGGRALRRSAESTRPRVPGGPRTLRTARHRDEPCRIRVPRATLRARPGRGRGSQPRGGTVTEGSRSAWSRSRRRRA